MLKYILIGVGIIFVLFWFGWSIMGAGVVEKAFTLGGMYVVIRPDGYDAACFVEKKAGHLDCIPCSQINDCKKR